MTDLLDIPEFLKRTEKSEPQMTTIEKRDWVPINVNAKPKQPEPVFVKGQKLVLSKAKQNNIKGWALASDLEDAVFELLDVKEVISIIRKTEATPVIARIALQKFNDLAKELMLIGFDDDVTEAYEYLGNPKKVQNKAREVAQTLNQYINNKRNKGKKASAKVEKKLINVKYRKEDELLQVTSLTPSEIIGKQIAVVFDSKSRHLILFKAKDADGLTIEGTTIKNFDPNTSKAKNVRKPEKMINGMVRATAHRIQKQFDDINAKEKPASGRTNMNSLFVRVFK